MSDNFLESIINEVDSDLETRPKVKAKFATARQGDSENPTSSKTEEKVVQIEKKIEAKPRLNRKVVPTQIENPRVFSKARIQKSIRFRPELIARLDAYMEQLEASGEEPISLQWAQNEALKQWLDSKMK